LGPGVQDRQIHFGLRDLHDRAQVRRIDLAGLFPRCRKPLAGRAQGQPPPTQGQPAHAELLDHRKSEHEPELGHQGTHEGAGRMDIAEQSEYRKGQRHGHDQRNHSGLKRLIQPLGLAAR